MTKKKQEKTAEHKNKKHDDDSLKNMPMPQAPGMPELPKDAQEKLKEIKDKLEKFRDKVNEKFDKYIMGITLLPPPKPNDEGVLLDEDGLPACFGALSRICKGLATSEM